MTDKHGEGYTRVRREDVAAQVHGEASGEGRWSQLAVPFCSRGPSHGLWNAAQGSPVAGNRGRSLVSPGPWSLEGGGRGGGMGIPLLRGQVYIILYMYVYMYVHLHGTPSTCIYLEESACTVIEHKNNIKLIFIYY